MTSPRVTLDDFLAWMETQKGWVLHNGSIRIAAPLCAEANWWCPLIAWTRNENWYCRAAERLGMNIDTQGMIIRAVDNSRTANPVVRSRLLRAAGVEEGR